MKQIFLESHNIKNPYFGFGQFNYHLIKALYSINDPEFEFTLHAKDFSKLKDEFGSHFKYKKYKSITRYPLFRIAKRYDLWHSLNQNIKIEPCHKIPYVMTVHDIHFIDEKGDDESKQRFIDKLNRCSAIIYISKFVQQHTREHFKIPKVPEYVIYNGNTILNSELPETHNPSFLPTRNYLYSIGEFTERKNFGSLVKMLAYLPDYDLILSGNSDKPYHKELLTLIAELNLTNRVHITGKVSDEDKKFYMKNCTAFVFPSLREGFGIPPIEAMTFGKPVFMSNNTSLPEIGGRDAFYWDHYDPEYMAQIFLAGMEKSNNDPDFSKRVKDHANSFNWNETARNYLAVYKEVLS